MTGRLFLGLITCVLGFSTESASALTNVKMLPMGIRVQTPRNDEAIEHPPYVIRPKIGIDSKLRKHAEYALYQEYNLYRWGPLKRWSLDVQTKEKEREWVLVFTDPDGVGSEKHRLPFADIASLPIRTWFQRSYEGWAGRGPPLKGRGGVTQGITTGEIAPTKRLWLE
jgi:hypothetical protein